MRQVVPYSDVRQRAFCIYCGGKPDTRERVPPKVFLDSPYPANLPVVPSCAACNVGWSLDEEFVACLLEVVACRSARPEDLLRLRIARKLARGGPLAERLEAWLACVGASTLAPFTPRVARVIDKMALGIWSFETGECDPAATVTSHFRLIPPSPPDQLFATRLLNTPSASLLPEVGSRRMSRVLQGIGGKTNYSWENVQTERFAYRVIDPPICGVSMLIRGCLAAEITIG